MLYTWTDIIDTYNSLNHISKSNKNLPIWGEVFASAYKLQPRKADALWQDIIEKNAREDEKYSKYFVAQVLNSIIDHLSIEDAIELSFYIILVLMKAVLTLRIELKNSKSYIIQLK